MELTERKIDIPDEVKALSPEAAAALRAIEPTITVMGHRLYPCEIVADDGSVHPRVYVMEAEAYIREWGVWPWKDRGKGWLPPQRVRSIRSSPERLPPRFANELMKAGESGMGYCAFAVKLRDGRVLHYVTGNAVDFPRWPEGVRPEDVDSVRAHARLAEHRDRGPTEEESCADYLWCVYRPT